MKSLKATDLRMMGEVAILEYECLRGTLKGSVDFQNSMTKGVHQKSEVHKGR